MLKPNEYVERFNDAERKRKRSVLRKRKRPVSKALKKLDEAIERRAPKDCVSKKWIGLAADPIRDVPFWIFKIQNGCGRNTRV